jgi:acyl carrier protein
LNWESISSIEEIDKIKNLVAISLPDSSIKDLSPLKNLSSLIALNLSATN